MSKQNLYQKRQQQHASASRITPCSQLFLTSQFFHRRECLYERGINHPYKGLENLLSHPPLLQGTVASRWVQSSHFFSLLAHLLSSKWRLLGCLWGCSLGSTVKHSAALMATLHTGHKTALPSDTAPMLCACETTWREGRCSCRDTLSASITNTCCEHPVFFSP